MPGWGTWAARKSHRAAVLEGASTALVEFTGQIKGNMWSAEGRAGARWRGWAWLAHCKGDEAGAGHFNHVGRRSPTQGKNTTPSTGSSQHERAKTSTHPACLSKRPPCWSREVRDEKRQQGQKQAAPHRASARTCDSKKKRGAGVLSRGVTWPDISSKGAVSFCAEHRWRVKGGAQVTLLGGQC